MAGFKPLLGALLFFIVTQFIFVCIATAIIDWSKSELAAYGIWRICAIDNDNWCTHWDNTELPQYKDCEGALIATQAFSVISIIWTGFCMLLVVAILIKPAKLLNKKFLLVNLCMNALNWLWLFLGWIMWLGVSARGHCYYHDYTDYHYGSSWFLQLFAWIIAFITIVLCILLLSKWKKTPKYVGGYPAVAGGPVPYAGPGAYPQKGGPYKPSYYAPGGAPGAFPPPPYPYAAGYPAASYGYGPTPTTSPYLPTPYY